MPTAVASVDLHNSRVGEIPPDRRAPEVGTLSANGSRRWDGQYWVPVYTDAPLEELPPPVAYRPVTEFSYEQRGYGLAGVVLAPIVGVVMGSIHFPPPATGSLDSGLVGFMVINLLWGLLSYGAVVVILSLGRQGVDVLLLRAVVVAFIQGAAFMAIPLIGNTLNATPFQTVPGIVWPLAVLAVGLFSALWQGPLLAAFAILANLLWYRSLRSLRPQLPVFNRVPQVPQ
jgi:hypothetical protein